MSNKKDFFKLWNKYLKNQKLNESSQEAIDAISRASSAAFRDPSLLPFNSIFGDKLRIVEPLQQKNVDKVAMILATILANFAPSRENNYTSATIDVKSVMKKMKQKPLGWVQGDPIPEVEKQIIELSVNIPRLSVNPETKEEQVRTMTTTVVGGLKEVVKEMKKEIKKHTDEYVEKYGEQPPTEEAVAMSGQKDFDASRIIERKKRLEIIPSIAKWWQDNQGRFILDPDLLILAKEKAEAERYAFDIKTFNETSDENLGKVESKYSIIYSRVPVDILRMSDFSDEGLESCHSEGNEYFVCALAEAQNEGAIAYAVNTEDLEKIDLDDPEIFYDRQRRIQGIAPVSRVRLRNITDKSTGIAIAVPSSRIYGERLDNFLNTVKKFAVDSQAKALVTIDEEGNKRLNISSKISDFIHRGGSYEDSPGVGTGFVNFLQQLTKEQKVEPSQEQQELIKNIGYNIKNVTREQEFTYWSSGDDDEDDLEELRREEAENTFSRGLSAVERNTTLDVSGCDFEWEWGDGASILANFKLEYQININQFTPEYGKDADDDNVSDDIHDRLAHKDAGVFVYPDVSLKKVDSYVNNNVRHIVLIYESTYYDADLFNGACRDLVRWFENETAEGIEKRFYEILEEYEIIRVGEEESPRVKFRNFTRNVGNDSNYFNTEIKGTLAKFKFFNKQKPRDHFIVAKLDPMQAGGLFSFGGRNVVNGNGNLLFNSQIIYVFGQSVGFALQRLLVNMPTVSTDKVKQMKLPFTEKHSDNTLDDRSFMCTITFDVVGEYLRDSGSGLADHQSTKKQYDLLLKEIEFSFNYINEQDKLNQFQEMIEQIDNDPQSLLDKVYEAIRLNFTSFYKEQTAQQVKDEIEKIEAERQQQQSLTESRKKIIRENLLRLLRRNKGKK